MNFGLPDLPADELSRRFNKWLRQPEFTGDNRCLPCTILNLGIAAGGSLIIVVGLTITGVDELLSGALGAITLGFSGLLIYYRGYLIPYTPTITKRYFPERVLAWFDKHPGERTIGAEDNGQEIDINAFLADLGILTDCEYDDVCLTEEFQSKWTERMAAVNSIENEKSAIATAFEVPHPDQLTISNSRSQAVDVRANGRRIGRWESKAALIADVTADELLRAEYPEWSHLDLVARSKVLGSLRMFLEQCPTCASPVKLGEETVESCCRSREVIAVNCTDCGARLFEMEITPEVRQEMESAS